MSQRITCYKYDGVRICDKRSLTESFFLKFILTIDKVRRFVEI